MPDISKLNLNHASTRIAPRIAGATILFLLVFGWFTAHAQQINPPQQVDPTIEVLITALNNQKSDIDQRRTMAQALLQTPKAHPALIGIFHQSGNLSTKIIICDIIASGPSQLQPFNTEKLSQNFIDALFIALQDDNTDLALKAAQALTRCHNGVPGRLIQIAQDQTQKINHRLAAIAALELTAGKNTLIALFHLQKDDNPQIKIRAAQALRRTIYPNNPGNFDSLPDPNLDVIMQIDEKTILLWRIDQLSQQLKNTQLEIERVKQQGGYWLEELLIAKTKEFNNLDNPQKLDFLKAYLRAPSESQDDLCIWAIQQISDWCTPATAPPQNIILSLVDLLKPFISHDNPSARQQTALALEVLVEFAQPTAPDLLEQLKKEPNPNVQADILFALGAFEYNQVADQALLLLNSPQEAVVAQAARTLGIICQAKENSLSPDLIEKITRELLQTYQRHPTSVEIRHDLLFAVKKIAPQQNYRQLVIDTFDAILKNALKDPSPTLRRDAVDALTEIYHQDVLNLILDKNLLNDPDTAVRLDVLNAIEKYPDRNMLKPLRQRLAQENVSDVARAIRNAFEIILQSLPFKDADYWAESLQIAANQNRYEQLLYRRVVGIMDEKIKKQQQSDLVVPPEFEIRLLLHQVNLDLNDNQFDQAINKYYALLNLMAAEDDKDTYRREIIKLVLNHTDDQNLLSRGLEALKQLLNRPAASAALLNEIQSVCDQYRTDDKLLLPSAKIIIELIIPPELNELLSPDLQKNWDNRRRVVALKIITQQQELLAGDNPQRNNPQAIQLLRQLVQSQLKDLPDFPAGQAPQIRLEWLSAAAKLIQGYVPF